MLLSKPDYIWRTVGTGTLARVKTATGEIVAKLSSVWDGTATYDGASYIDIESAKRACEAKYPSGENFT